LFAIKRIDDQDGVARFGKAFCHLAEGRTQTEDVWPDKDGWRRASGWVYKIAIGSTVGSRDFYIMLGYLCRVSDGWKHERNACPYHHAELPTGYQSASLKFLFVIIEMVLIAHIPTLSHLPHVTSKNSDISRAHNEIAMISLTALPLLVSLSFVQGQGYISGGTLKLEQAAYDVQSYDISIKVNPAKRTISGTTVMEAKTVISTGTILIDLDAPYTVSAVTDGKTPLRFERLKGAIRVFFPLSKQPGDPIHTEVTYAGTPHVARNAPWDLCGQKLRVVRIGFR
jgi:hypothetical protein